MRILLFIMGALALLTSCTGRKESTVEKKNPTLKEVKLKKDDSCLDSDTLTTNRSDSNGSSDTIWVFRKKLDINAFERYYEEFDDGSSIRKSRLSNGTLRERFKYSYQDTTFYYVIDYPKNSYLCYENEYYENGNIRSERTRIIYGDMYVGTSYYYSINGELQKEVKEDEGYSFTIDQLMHLLKKKGINIHKGAKVVNGEIDMRYRIRKLLDPDQPGYFVMCSLDPHKDSIFAMAQDSVFIISGKDGSIINEHRYILEYN